jgi:hypothetical protein
LTGTQDAAERRANLRRFLDGNASVLLATDVASQGLNLQQRCRWVISLELPWNPARLEQRIGRVDRLGQTGTPHMTLLISRHASESTLLAHMARRVLTARREFSDDSLSTLPNEASLAAALLQCAPASAPAGAARTESASSTPIAPSARWRRIESTVARELERRRCLVHRWRTSLDERGGPIWSHGTRNVVLCSVPIRNGRDELIDQLLVAASLSTAFPGVMKSIAEAITVAAARRMRRMIRKSMRRAGLRASRMIERERAIARFIHEDEFPGEIQQGLFERRNLAAATLERSRCSRRMEVSERLIERWREDRAVHAGAAVVEILWIARS